MADEQEVKGTVDKGVGKAKETWGRATGDSKTEAEGQNQQLEGQLRQTAGRVRRNAQHAGDRIADAADRARDAVDDKTQS
jgi:uncharacterized protein YjbJ (UPF0337 family)